MLMVIGVAVGFGTHMWNINLSKLTPNVLSVGANADGKTTQTDDIPQRLTILAMIFPVATFFLKLSIALLYVRLFGQVMRRSLLTLLYVINTITGLLYLGVFIVHIVYLPRCSNLLRAMQDPLCLDSTRNQTLLTGVFSMVADIFLLVFPMPTIIKLQMPLGRKLGVVATLGSGGL